ncbi:cobalamin B12-binding domain-containing protein [Candidatus Poribacteria bacterium]|nr:cobalamin B12-binding domain-containing protein [Candidatus Poribacteria bacterium]
MRVLLVKPHSWFSAKGVGLPLGLAYLGGELLHADHQVSAIDLMLSKPEEARADLARRFFDFQPDIVGVTCNSHERLAAFEVARWIKSLQDIPVVMGGPHVTFTAEQTLCSVREVDIVVLHEGEHALRDICDSMTNGSSLDDVKGIVFRRNGRILKTQHRPFIADLDLLPMPARHLFEQDKYDLYLPIEDRPKAVHIVSSRGCPYPCFFCSATRMAGGKARMRSAEHVVREVQMVAEDHPSYKWVFFYDDHFTLSKERVMEICERMMQKRLGLNWGCYGRADSLDKELVRAMKAAGCRMISFGVESGSDHVLRLMGKRVNRQAIDKAIDLTKSEGIVARCSFFFGYPGERFVDVFKTLRMISKMGLEKDEVVWSECPVLYPGTILLDKLVRDGFISQDFNWSASPTVRSYKDVPIYVSGFSNVRKTLVRGYLKFFVENRGKPLVASVPEYIVSRLARNRYVEG